MKNTNIDKIEIGVRAHNALKAIKVNTTKGLLKTKDEDLVKICRLFGGAKTLDEIRGIKNNILGNGN